MITGYGRLERMIRVWLPVIFFVVIALFPFYWMAITSIKPNSIRRPSSPPHPHTVPLSRTRPQSPAADAGASPAGFAAWEVARVEAGRPEWGVDIDDSTIPQEANFDELGAISYTKGCYIGQEVVARVHFRGHVNRHLRGLLSGAEEPPPTGAQLIDEGGNHIGDVRSSVVSPRLGGIAMGMVRREVAPGATLKAKWETGERRVGVTTLPFSD